MMPWTNLFSASQYFLKFARRADDLETLRQNIGKYIHFSFSDRFGLNYRSVYPGVNPIGVYGFPLGMEQMSAIDNNKHSEFDLRYFKPSSMPYIYVFDINGTVLNLDEASERSLHQKFGQWAVDNFEIGEQEQWYLLKMLPGSNLYDVLKQILNTVELRNSVSRKEMFFNRLFRESGFDAIVTNNYALKDNIKSQVVVVNPSAVNLVAKIQNPMVEILASEQIETSKQSVMDHLNEIEFLIDYLGKGVHQATSKQIIRSWQKLMQFLSKEEDPEIYTQNVNFLLNEVEEKSSKLASALIVLIPGSLKNLF